MRLRNKKTGEVVALDDVIVCTSGGLLRNRAKHYDSLAKLNEEWEDYNPAEPLIKDEKIRKAVRAWAEANGRNVFKVINEHFNNCSIVGFTGNGTPSKSMIDFGTTIAGAQRDRYYTIAELCGEEEE